VKGKIARWFEYRGYGFIDVDGQQNDIFVHTSDIKGLSSPTVGDEVEFEVETAIRDHERLTWNSRRRSNPHLPWEQVLYFHPFFGSSLARGWTELPRS